MTNKPDPKQSKDAAPAIGVAVATSDAVHPHVNARVTSDPDVLDQGRVFTEALNQTRPIARSAAEARRIAGMVCKGTARPNGLTRATAERMANSGRRLDTFISGQNPRGKAAEVVVIADYRAAHSGRVMGIVNMPAYVSRNLRDIRLAPDSASRKDLVFGFDSGTGAVIWKLNGQVKTGGSQYVTRSLVEMAQTPGYGKVGYVDARYVDPDGTPRVAPDAFTVSQARRLQRAGVRLRGFPDLEQRAGQLMENIEASEVDGLDPVARRKLQQFRDDIASAYCARDVVGRMGMGAASAAASAGIASLVVQWATEGLVDAKTVGKSAGTAALFGAAGAAADAGLYHLGTRGLEMSPEAAKALARQSVNVGFCVLAVGGDVFFGFREAHRGDVTWAAAVSVTAAKTALDLLPLILAPLGLAGLPVLVGVQAGGRSLITKARDADRTLAQAIAEDDELADDISRRMSAFSLAQDRLATDCSATDDLYFEVMGDQ